MITIEPEATYTTASRATLTAPLVHWVGVGRFILVPAGFEYRVLPARWVPPHVRHFADLACLLYQWLAYKPKGASRSPRPGIYDGHPNRLAVAQYLGAGDSAKVIAPMLRCLPWHSRIAVYVLLGWATR